MPYLDIFMWLAASKKNFIVQFGRYVKWLLNFTHMRTVLFWVITQRVMTISYSIWKKISFFLTDFIVPPYTKFNGNRQIDELIKPIIHFPLNLYIFVSK